MDNPEKFLGEEAQLVTGERTDRRKIERRSGLDRRGAEDYMTEEDDDSVFVESK